jgi:hypothetical protein
VIKNFKIRILKEGCDELKMLSELVNKAQILNPVISVKVSFYFQGITI